MAHLSLSKLLKDPELGGWKWLHWGPMHQLHKDDNTLIWISGYRAKSGCITITYMYNGMVHEEKYYSIESLNRRVVEIITLHRLGM